MIRQFLLVTFFSFFGVAQAMAQIDTEYWFAPPDVTSGHGESPVFIRVATLEEPADVVISIPASRRPISSISLAANQSRTIDLTPFLSLLETRGNDRVQNSGLHIQSTAPISAYYEIGAFYNADIFALKGKNSLGNDFVIPSQNIWNNGDISRYNPPPFSSFDIVATENNTVVWITPSNDVVGHPKGETFLIKLNKGQTYSVTNASRLARDNLGGSIVKSNKPIAITIKEDSLGNNGCFDVIGDQLVPVKVAGLEYVVLRGQLETTEYAIITAIEDNTSITATRNSTTSISLNRGEMQAVNLNSPSTYIRADKPIYVTQVTGFGCELGMAVIPSINCRGSNQISFTRATDDFFGLNILVRKEGISGFSINGNRSIASGDKFRAVAGTGDVWYYAQIELSPEDLRQGRAGLILNQTNSFQIGIINGDARTSTKFGYFSAFSTLFIGDDQAICQGESIILDAGAGKDDYLWNTGSTEQTIEVSEAGTYYVSSAKESCVLSDTIKIEVKTASFDLGPDIDICPGDTAKIDAQQNFSYLWSDGSTDQVLNATEEGTYSVQISDFTGCKAKDSVAVALKDAPSVDLGSDVTKCPREVATFDATFPGASYLWNTGATTPTINVTEDTIYYADVSWNGCTVRDSVMVTNFPGPQQDTIIGTRVVCPFVQEITYEINQIPKDNFEWFVGGGSIVTDPAQNTVQIDWNGANDAAFLKALVTDSLGCESDTILLPVRINERLAPLKPTGSDTICINQASSIPFSTNFTNGSVYTWDTEATIEEGDGTNEIVLSFPETGFYTLQVNEYSETNQAVCDGDSPILRVLVYEDSSNIQLNYVTVNQEGPGIQLGFETKNQSSIASPQIFIYSKDVNADSWVLLESIDFNSEIYNDVDADGNSEKLQYKLEVINNCGELLSTSIHNNMVLQGDSDQNTDMIQLEWNTYDGWGADLLQYEIWRKLDSEEFVLYSVIDKTLSAFGGQIGADGFHHTYKIKAISTEGVFSWSNEVSFEFEHPVYVPNVITPNGDNKNDFFSINKIELYQQSKLEIVNRYGKTVYKTEGYQNGFDGRNLSTGVYFYHLDLGTGISYSGTLSILR